MNRSILVGMVVIGGCADLERADPELDGAQELEIVQADTSADLEALSSTDGLPPVLNLGAGCDLGAFCAYNKTNAEEPLSLETQVNWSGTAVARSVYNHGRPLPGLDHVQVYWTRSDGVRKSRCVHYANGPGHWFNFNSFFLPVTVTRVVWRGECRPGEDVGS